MEIATSVVIVDDNASFVQSICQFFNSQSNFEIKGTANNIKDAYSLILKKQPDAVLLDVQMPEAHGLKLISLLKAEKTGKKPYFFIMGNEGVEGVMQHAQTLDITYCMIKPFDFKTAAERIYSLCKYENENKWSDSYYESITRTNMEMQIEAKVNAILYSMGLTPKIQGFQYLKDSVLFTFKSGKTEYQKASSIYLWIASRYHTTPACVERAIHYAKTLAVKRKSRETESILKHCVCNINRPSPTNLKLIQAIFKRVQ